jgi:hypothetical protein
MRMDDLVSVMAAFTASVAPSCTPSIPHKRRLRLPEAHSMVHMVWTRKTSWLFLRLTLALCKLTSLILTPYITDILKSQLFPDQTQYFPKTCDSSAMQYIGDGGKWVAVHSNTATL